MGIFHEKFSPINFFLPTLILIHWFIMTLVGFYADKSLPEHNAVQPHSAHPDAAISGPIIKLSWFSASQGFTHLRGNQLYDSKHKKKPEKIYLKNTIKAKIFSLFLGSDSEPSGDFKEESKRGSDIQIE
ncbi:hypothetical protein KIL84_004805 [Mauremys mutica]|uniref:Uncharacterized protein n=1 Tax=Mauremys mutica TaxID=74926 RepID=A0A9D3XP29_9SAUR|nr:hypothetical protein KIL84_004719 [Mauremys mutica]KAH1183313.1 hypothetical protein KIL84_004805 [Mauremys mutica]